MIHLGILSEMMPPGWESGGFRFSHFTRVREVLSRSRSPWARRVSQVEGGLFRSLVESVVVMEGPWGIVYLDEYEPGWCVTAHGVFWGRGVARGQDEFKALTRAVFAASDVLRIQISFLETPGRLARVLSRAGFTRDGLMRLGGRDVTGHVTDREIWSILREEAEDGIID